MRFKVTYKTQGRIRTAFFEAPTQSALEDKLKAERILCLEITPKPNAFSLQRKISTKVLLSAFYEFKLGLQAKLPLQTLLENLQVHSKNKALALRFQKALYALNSGKSLAQSFKEAGFSDFICAMLLIGQKTNRLEEVLHLIILRLKNTQKNQQLLTKMLLYPSFVACMMVAVFLGVTLFVLPQFEVLFSGVQANLPFVSQSLLFMRKCVLDYGVISGVFCLMVCGALSFVYLKVESFRVHLDAILLRIALFGKVLYYFEMVQFLLSFFWLYQTKVPLQESLEIATKSLHNRFLRKKAAGIFPAVSSGVVLKDALGILLDVFGKQVLSGVHNEAGFLECLEVLLELYKEELQTRSQALLSAIEPLMILMLGGLILWLALGIFLPLWELPLQMQSNI